MPNRLHVSLIFAAFGTLAALGVFLSRGVGDIPSETIAIIVIAAIAAGLTAWPLAPRLSERGTFFAMLTGAVIMLLAQVTFAALTLAFFSLGDPLPLIEVPKAFAFVVAAGWAIAAPFQVVCGALAGWTVRRISPQRIIPDEDDPEV